jgi:hypothetical protein
MGGRMMSALAFLFLADMTRLDPMPDDRRTGSNNPKAKINEEIARSIKARIGAVEDGRLCSVRRLAAEFGIGKSTVHAIVTGRKWRHV